jgi:small subunit ribosomal protein S2
MQRVPDAMFVVDLKTEEIAVREAQRLRIPIIGLVDTNVDPQPVTYAIPGNDDAIRACKVIIEAIGGVVQHRAGQFRAEEERARREAEEQARREAEAKARREAEEVARQEAAERERREAAERAHAEQVAAAQSQPAPDQAPATAGVAPAAQAGADSGEAARRRATPAGAETPPTRPRGPEGADVAGGEQIDEASNPTQEVSS